MVREEKEIEDFSPMEKLEEKYKHYPRDIYLPTIIKVYDDGKRVKEYRSKKRYRSRLSDKEVEMWKAAPQSEYCGMAMLDKDSNVYWVFIGHDHKLYKGSRCAASEGISTGYGSTKRM